MQKVKCLSIIILITFSFPYLTANDASNMQKDDLIYLYLDLLLSELNIIEGHQTKPYSLLYCKQLIQKIEKYRHNLSKEGLRLLDIVQKWIAVQKSDYIFTLLPLAELASEFYLNTPMVTQNNSLAERVQEDNPQALKMLEECKSPLAIGFDLSISEYFNMLARFDLKPDILARGQSYHFTNFYFESIKCLDFTFPYQGYLKFTHPYFNLELGRDWIQWGPGESGELLISSARPYYDQLKFQVGNSWFSFTSLLSQLDPYLTEAEKKAQKDLDRQDPNFDGDEAFADYAKLMAAHRFEIRFFDWVRFAASEMNIVGGKVAEFTDWLPLLIYHNTYGEGFSNVILSVELSTRLVYNFFLYGHIIIDDVVVSVTEGNEKPTSLGFLAGLKKIQALPLGYLKAFFEFVYIYPFTYSRKTPYTTIMAKHFYMSNYYPPGRFYAGYPIGYFQGPDVMSFYLNTLYFVPSLGGINLMLENRYKGELGIDHTKYAEKPFNTQNTPTWVYEYSLHLYFNIYSIIFPMSKIYFQSQFSWYNHYQQKHDLTHFEFFLTVGAQFKLDLMWFGLYKKN